MFESNTNFMIIIKSNQILNSNIRNAIKCKVKIISPYNFIFISLHKMDSRARSSQPKNKSMLSTQNMSCAQSYATNFYNDQKANRSALLEYADIPFEKIPPRWNQSSATWRNTSHKYSFSKDSRFKDYKVEYTDIIEPEIPTTRTSKSCTFGKGKKRPISEITLRNAKEKPAPDRYNLEEFDQSPRKSTRGKSFGLSWRAYDKSFIDHRKDVYAAFQNEDNPPAKYQVREKPGDDKRKFSMYGRLKMYTQRMAESKNWVPGARYLVKDRHLENEVGMHERNFGFGERLDLSMPANNYPGAKYIIPGFTARFHKLAKKMEKALVEEVKVQE